jgi:hypothetical protein
MNLFTNLTVTVGLTMINLSFKSETSIRYFLHHGPGVTEILTQETVTIANRTVSFTNAYQNIVLLTSVDTIFMNNIITKMPDSLRNDTFNLKHFAIPLGNRKFSIQPITPLIAGKITAKTHSDKPNGLFSRNYLYDGNKQRVGVFRLKHRPYIFLLEY